MYSYAQTERFARKSKKYDFSKIKLLTCNTHGIPNRWRSVARAQIFTRCLLSFETVNSSRWVLSCSETQTLDIN